MQIELDMETLRRLRQLCHPDRHSGSKTAELVTQWLNKVASEFKDSGPGPRMADDIRGGDFSDVFSEVMRRANRFSDMHTSPFDFHPDFRDWGATAEDIRRAQEATAANQREAARREEARHAANMQQEIYRRQRQAADARAENLRKFTDRYHYNKTETAFADMSKAESDAELEKMKRPEPTIVVKDGSHIWPPDKTQPSDWDWLNDVARGHSKFNEKWSGEIAYKEVMKIRSKRTHEENKRPTDDGNPFC